MRLNSIQYRFPLKRGVMTFYVMMMFWACLAVNPQAHAASTHKYDATAIRIFAYHRIGEDRYPDTSIRREQFEAHIQELASGNYNVIALPDAIATLKSGNSFPPRTVVLTFDGGHASIAKYAVPLLLKHKFPFTLFISSNLIDSGSNEYMRWGDIKKLAKNDLVTIGMHPASYRRLYRETDKTIKQSIHAGRSRIRDMTGANADLFAYPFGEYSHAYMDIIADTGFRAAVTQNSAVAHLDSTLFELPRFSMTEGYGSVDRFRLLANALPLPLEITAPQSVVLSETEDVKHFTLRYNSDVVDNIARLSCFLSDQGRLEFDQDAERNRAEDENTDDKTDEQRTKQSSITLEYPLVNGRNRLNCTYPAHDDTAEQNGRNLWRWFGKLLIYNAPDAPGMPGE